MSASGQTAAAYLLRHNLTGPTGQVEGANNTHLVTLMERHSRFAN
jgi:hypothetical protein